MAGSPLSGKLKAVWRAILLVLEVIGLREPPRQVDHAAMLSRFKLYHTEFRKLLTANNSFLETIAELEHKLRGKEFIDRSYVKRKVVRAVADVHAMVESINVISGERYPALREARDRIVSELTSLVQEQSVSAGSELLLDLSQIYSSHADLVGGKMANLGEIRNALGLPTPEGFAVSTEGFRLLLEEGGIRSWIQDAQMELRSEEEVEPLSKALQDRLLASKVPPALEEAILDAYDRMAERLGYGPPMAVRSSAIGEDSDLSFAGQFLSLLNVPRHHLPHAYLQVVASLYSPEAIHYRRFHGIPGESAEMAVGFLSMVDSVASGIAFSKDPNRPDSGHVLIQAVRGLGVTLADGRASPEVILVSSGDESPAVTRIPGEQKAMVVPSEGHGVKEEPLDREEAQAPAITDEEALTIARWALELEAHFEGPQDIEWAIGPQRRVFLVQSRPLRISARSLRREGPVAGFRLLVDGGEVGCPGVGIGPAVHMDADGDLDSFPEGGVLVARRSSPRFIRLMARAKAIVADAGSTTGHMASLARELRVPTLLNTRNATRAIPPGMIVTVDAGNAYVYEGEVPLLATKEAQEEAGGFFVSRRASPEFRLLERVVEQIVPLNLTDPSSPSFAADQCRTLHDLARYVHERSYAEMFGLGEKLGDMRPASYLLDVFLPIDLYIIDLGGGLKEVPKGNKVKRSQIASVPLTALLKGMLHERIPRFGPRAMTISGLFSVMMRHATTSPEQERSFQDPCYALISDSYLNYTARVGYHFSVVDAYCSPTPNKNYISVLFRGGAADYARRSRRIRAIAGVLEEKGFSVTATGDVLSARLGKATREETVAQLEMLGSLLQFFRQMDAAMGSDESVTLFQEAFLKGDYDLSEAMGKTRPSANQGRQSPGN
jgi:pyruvate,water dikinase